MDETGDNISPRRILKRPKKIKIIFSPQLYPSLARLPSRSGPRPHRVGRLVGGSRPLRHPHSAAATLSLQAGWRFLFDPVRALDGRAINSNITGERAGCCDEAIYGFRFVLRWRLEDEGLIFRIFGWIQYHGEEKHGFVTRIRAQLRAAAKFWCQNVSCRHRKEIDVWNSGLMLMCV